MPHASSHRRSQATEERRGRGRGEMWRVRLRARAKRWRKPKIARRGTIVSVLVSVLMSVEFLQ